jgi:hypothetical protein
LSWCCHPGSLARPGAGGGPGPPHRTGNRRVEAAPLQPSRPEALAWNGCGAAPRLP